MKIKHPKTLGRLVAMLNKVGGDDGLDLLLADKLVLVDPEKGKRGFKSPDREPLFTFAGRFRAPGAKEFNVAKKFVIDTSESACVRISYLGNNFKTNFLPKVERNIDSSDLVLSKLVRDQHDLPMSEQEPGTIAGLGGLFKAETTTCEFYETLAHKQVAGDFTWTGRLCSGRQRRSLASPRPLGRLWLERRGLLGQPPEQVGCWLRVRFPLILICSVIVLTL